eukprot:887486-Rhodomonas_salina.2
MTQVAPGAAPSAKQPDAKQTPESTLGSGQSDKQLRSDSICSAVSGSMNGGDAETGFGVFLPCHRPLLGLTFILGRDQTIAKVVAVTERKPPIDVAASEGSRIPHVVKGKAGVLHLVLDIA